MRRRSAALLIPVLILGSCASKPETPLSKVPIPSYQQIQEAQNQRVRYLDRVWSRTVVRIDFKDEEGRDRSEQLEGHLQVVQPRNLLMTFHKLGELYFIVGSNDEQYWWIRLGDQKQAAVGRYDLATARSIARFELAVHPLDFIDLLAIGSLPPDLDIQPTRHADLVQVTVPARWGTRQILFDPLTLEPAGVNLYDAQGRLAATSELTRYRDVAVERPVEPMGLPPRLPQRFWVTAPDAEVSVKVDLYAMETSERRPSPGVFDFQRLLSMYHVEDVVDLDAPPH